MLFTWGGVGDAMFDPILFYLVIGPLMNENLGYNGSSVTRKLLIDVGWWPIDSFSNFFLPS
jgi:hypothetical protein